MIEIKGSEFFGPGELKIPIYEYTEVRKEGFLTEYHIDAGDYLIDMTITRKEQAHDDLPH